MKSYIRALASSMVVVGMLGVVGCGPDNESEAQKATADAKDPGPVNPNAIKAPVVPMPKTQAEFFKNTPNPQAQNPNATPAPEAKK